MQMIYRPQTGDNLTLDGKTVNKITFRGVPCDAIAVAPELVPEYTSKGWFDDPNQMIDEPKPRQGKKASDSRNQDRQ